MKTIAYLTIPAAAILLLSGCERSDGTQSPALGTERTLIRATVEPTASETRIAIDKTGYKWNDHDTIGLVVGTTNIPATLVYAQDGTVYFEPATAIEPGTTVYGYYPYTEQTEAIADVLTLTLPNEQTTEYAGQLAPVMPMVAPEATVNEDGTMDLLFKPLGSIAGLKVWSSDPTWQSEQVTSVHLGSFDMLAGDLTLNFRLPEIDLTSLSSSDVTLDLTNPSTIAASKEDATLIYVVVPAMTLGGLNATVTTDKASYQFTQETPVNVDFRANTIHTISMDLTQSERTIILTGVPFTTAIYDYSNRDPNGNQWGQIITDYPREIGLSWDQLGYSITLTNSEVVRYWVYCDLYEAPNFPPSKLTGPFMKDLSDEDLLAACIKKGTECTENDTVAIMVREGGPSTKSCAVAVAVEFKDGTRAVYRTHRIGSMRGGASYLVWN